MMCPNFIILNVSHFCLFVSVNRYELSYNRNPFYFLLNIFYSILYLTFVCVLGKGGGIVSGSKI